MWFVYKHTFPNGKVYIGITSQKPQKRWGSFGQNYKHNSYMMRAINKFGWDNIEHEIIKEGLSKEEACKLEIELIAKYRSAERKYGYNLDLGGSGFNMTDEQKTKQSEKIKKLWLNEEYREHQIEALKSVWTPEMRKKHSGKNHPMYGKHFSEEVRAKLSANAKAKQSWKCMHTPEALAKGIQTRKPYQNKPVIIYFEDGTELIFGSTGSAARALHYDKSAISRHCKSKKKTQKGFYCEYLKETEDGQRLATLL